MDYKKIFKTALAKAYTDEELDVLFKLLIADIKSKDFNKVSLGQLHLSGEEKTTFHEAINQLKASKPIQHILGKADFYGLNFIVNKNVLIPRPETEELVDLIIKEQKNKAIDILDIGTGSGCIAVTLKRHLPNAKVSALDLSSPALDIAKQNAEKHQCDITFFNDDALNLYSNSYPKYDVIVSNPPYIAEKEKAEMGDLVLDNEPHLALFVDDNDVLIFYDKIGDFAVANLRIGGTLYLEINQKLGEETKKLIDKKGFNSELLKDLNDNFRMIKAQLRG